MTVPITSFLSIKDTLFLFQKQNLSTHQIAWALGLNESEVANYLAQQREKNRIETSQ